MMNSHEPKVGDLKEINGQTYKLCFNKNNGEWFYANQGETTNECPKYIKYEQRRLDELCRQIKGRL